MLHIYRFPGVSEASTLRKVQKTLPVVTDVRSEFCFNIEVKHAVPEEEMRKLKWLFTETFEPANVRDDVPFLALPVSDDNFYYLFEIGPRLAFTTAWSSNCASMCTACGILSVGRIERSRRFLLTSSRALTPHDQQLFLSIIHDRMTETVYPEPLQTFENGVQPAKVNVIPLLEDGRAALERVNVSQGFGFDEFDLDFYTDMFLEKLKRNPTE